MALKKINEYLQHTLREDFESPNPEVRKAAIFALGRLGSGPEVLDTLKHIAAEDDDPEVRYTAKKALSYWEGVLSEEVGEPEEVDILDPGGGLDLGKLEENLASPRSGLQIATIVAAVRHGDEACLPPLRALLQREQDPWVLSMAAKAVGSLGQPDHVQDLLPLLEHGNHRVVANAIEAVEMLDAPDREEHLGPFLDSNDNRVRANAVKALYPVAPERSMATLQDMARNHRPWMRASAIYCLKILDDPLCEPLLLEMLGQEFSEDLFRQILDTLMVRGSERAVGTLGWLREGRKESHQEALDTAGKVLAEKLGLGPARVRELVDEARNQTQGGARSGIFLVEDIEEPDEAQMREAPPAETMAASRVSGPGRDREEGDRPPGEAPGGDRAARGYGSPPQPTPPAADQSSRIFLAVALGLAALAAAVAGFRLMAG